MSKRFTFPLIAASLVMSSLAMARSSAEIPSNVEQKWLEFQRNPRALMDAPPQKFIKNSAGQWIPAPPSPRFSRYDVRTGAFATKKANARTGRGDNSVAAPICNEAGVCLKDVLSGRAAAPTRITEFLDMREFAKRGVRPTATLEGMEELGLKSAELAEMPWSDSYWPISQGILGNRYANSRFAGRGHDWKSYYDFINAKDGSLKSILERANPLELDILSPSEKYDLLIGTLQGPNRVYEQGYLTPHMWTEGQGYWNSYGKVEEWMGICHGWAIAAFMAPRPKTTVTTKAADEKTDLVFFPADIKGLTSYLWGKVQTPTRFIGGRCNDKDAKKDPGTGRVLDEDCFDTNPGIWHVSVVNQIGLAKRSMVMDATYDYEVWNHPIVSYKYRYFNPQTGGRALYPRMGKVAVADFTNDKFKKFRSPQTTHVIGIEMDVVYVIETEPNQNPTDSEANDATKSVRYMYDLELNAQGQIIGGEWYSNGHPDFLWMPVDGSRAVSFGDSGISDPKAWKPGQPVPAFWRDLAVRTAQNYAQPLAVIVEGLVQESHDAGSATRTGNR